MSDLRLLILMTLLSFVVSTQSQDIVTAPEPRMIDEGTTTTFVLKHDYPDGFTEIMLVDLFEGVENLFWDLRQIGYQVRGVDIPDRRHIFILEVQGEGTWDTGFFHLGPSRIVTINTETAEREIIYSSPNLVRFMISPDATHMLIGFYPGDFTFIDRSNISQTQWCVLTLGDVDTTCQMIEEGADNLSYPIWVNSRIIAYLSNGRRSINLIDIVTLELMPVEMPQGFEADIIAALPISGDLLILDTPFLQGQRLHILKLNMNSLTMTSVGEIRDLIGASSIVISPNEDSGVIIAGRNAYLVSLHDAHVFQSYPTIYDMEWVNIQWLPTEHIRFLVGQMRFRTRGSLTVVFEPVSNGAQNILPPLDGILIVVPYIQ